MPNPYEYSTDQGALDIDLLDAFLLDDYYPLGGWSYLTTELWVGKNRPMPGRRAVFVRK